MSNPAAVRAPEQEELPTTQLLPANPPPSRDRRGLSRAQLIVAGVSVVAVAGAAIGIWLGTRGKGSSTGLQVSSQVVTVSTGTMRQPVATSGTIEPAQQANLSFVVSGHVTAVNVSVGQKVAMGQSLATVDPTALQDQLAAAQAQLSAAQAKLSTDQSNGAFSSQVDADQAAVTSAQAQVTNAQTNLSNATLASTINGTVASVSLTAGQQVSAGGTGSGTGSGSANGTGSANGSGNGSGIGSSGSGASSAAGNASSSGSTAQIVVVSSNAFNVATTVDDTEVGHIQIGDQAVIVPSNSTTRSTARCRPSAWAHRARSTV